MLDTVAFPGHDPRDYSWCAVVEKHPKIPCGSIGQFPTPVQPLQIFGAVIVGTSRVLMVSMNPRFALADDTTTNAELLA